MVDVMWAASRSILFHLCVPSPITQQKYHKRMFVLVNLVCHLGWATVPRCLAKYKSV